jgi:polyphosphate glucokinase
VDRAIEQLRILTDFDHLYIGGGNARHLKPSALPPDVSTVDNTDGILGGFRLWQPDTPERGARNG